jgi:hypothetical protein
MNRLQPMNKHAGKTTENRTEFSGQSASRAPFQDSRPEAIAQQKRREALNSSPGVQQLKNYQQMASKSAVRAGVIQCFGAVRFANLGSDEKYQTKAAAIIASLQATPNIQQYLNNKNTLITLEATRHLATVIVKDDQVQITLSPWFFEQQSRGRILGMLLHEFGVHTLATEAMTETEQDQERDDITNKVAFPTGLPNHSITPEKEGQPDHVFAAVDGQPRFRSYQLTAYQMANAIYQRTLVHPSDVTEEHVTDLIMTYLSDIAMILATNDHRGKIVLEPKRTADAFNVVRANWLIFIQNQPNAPHLMRLTPDQQTRGSVLGEAASLAGGLALSIGTGSKDNAQLEQTKSGFFNPTYAESTPAQQGVLVDYGLNLQVKNTGAPTPSFLDAMDDASGQPPAYTAMNVLNEIQLRLPANTQARDDALKKLRQDIMNNTLGRPVSSDDLDDISHMLQRKIRIIKPDGKIDTHGNGGLLYLLEVHKPSTHYRFAV